MQGGVFVDGKEILPPGLLRERVGFVYEDHHYQIMHNKHTFANTGGKKGGKFILLVDGWEADTRKPLNKFFLGMYAKVGRRVRVRFCTCVDMHVCSQKGIFFSFFFFFFFFTPPAIALWSF